MTSKWKLAFACGAGLLCLSYAHKNKGIHAHTGTGRSYYVDTESIYGTADTCNVGVTYYCYPDGTGKRYYDVIRFFKKNKEWYVAGRQQDKRLCESSVAMQKIFQVAQAHR